VPIYKKKRLDRLLVDKGLAPTRSQAADMVRRGCVSVGGVLAVKPGALVTDESAVAVSPGAAPYVSRGGLKLEAALDAFGFDAAGKVALDLLLDRRLHRSAAGRRGGQGLCRRCRPLAAA
jgi:23S rRNA (cytidine1920-2'-O)/16S rRNA (cytidine1409-2'-O)-methyltransferase